MYFLISKYLAIFYLDMTYSLNLKWSENIFYTVLIHKNLLRFAYDSAYGHYQLVFHRNTKMLVGSVFFILIKYTVLIRLFIFFMCYAGFCLLCSFSIQLWLNFFLHFCNFLIIYVKLHAYDLKLLYFFLKKWNCLHLKRI